MVTTKQKQEASDVVPSSDNSMDVDEKPDVSDKKAKLDELKDLLRDDGFPMVADEKWYVPRLISFTSTRKCDVVGYVDSAS